MEEQKMRVLRPRRRGPPSDHTYSSFVTASSSHQFSSRTMPYTTTNMSRTDSHSPIIPTTTTLQHFNSDINRTKDSSGTVNGCTSQSVGEILSWLKEDCAIPHQDKASSTLTRYGSTDRVPENSTEEKSGVKQPPHDVFVNQSESSQVYTTSTLHSFVKSEVGCENLPWQNEISLRQRDCVVQKFLLLCSTGSLYQCALTGLAARENSRATLEHVAVKAQQLEQQNFLSAQSQEDYYYQIAIEISTQRERSSVIRDSVTQPDRKRKHGTDLLRSLLQGEPVTNFSVSTETPSSELKPSMIQAHHSEKTATSSAPGSKIRRKKKRRNEYDFGQKRKYPKQERQKVHYKKKERGGLCLISSHKIKSSTDLFTVPVSSGTILEECAEICDLRNSDSNLGESASPESELVRFPKVKTPRESCPFCVKCKLESKQRSLRRKNQQWKQGERYSTRLLIKHYKFPFIDLPLECKMHVFSFLNAKSKATASQVCLDWKNLLYDPDAWTEINLDFLDYNCSIPNTKRTKQRDAMAKSAYEIYQARVKHFIDFQSEHVHPRIESLSFHFDIGNFMDNWYAQVKKFLQNADLKKLVHFESDWQVTPAKPASLERYCCILNKTRVLFKLHHYRAHIFCKLLKQLTEQSPNVTSVKIPFDWSERAVLFLCRWKKVEELRLLQYLNLCPVSQICIDAVLSSLEYLSVLQIDICIPVYSHRLLFTLSHNTLVHLDLSNCRGFFLKRVCLPKLKTIQLSRKAWHGPLVDGDLQSLVCLYGLLCQGTPQLKWINRHQLHGYWLEFSYQELELLLNTVCPCAKHWTKENAA